MEAVKVEGVEAPAMPEREAEGMMEVVGLVAMLINYAQFDFKRVRGSTCPDRC